MTFITMDELLERAFQLAHFLHQDEATAKRIAVAAMERLETVLAAQDKRRYYNPTGKHGLPARHKVSLNELHLLQRLIYVESEGYEKQSADTARPSPKMTPEMMVIHFIKHLVKLTVRRNAFYVTLGVARLLHDYTTAETVGLYNVLAQDPRRVPDDDYWRARKACLMREVKDRFGPWLRTVRGPRGEERFEPHPDQSRFAALAQECLTRFTPWDTPCTLPEGFDPCVDELAALRFDGGDPDEEHPIEVSRIHAALHPSCFERIAMSLRLDAPPTRLALPRFMLFGEDSSDDDPPRERKRSTNLSDNDRRQMRQHLDQQAGRRKHSAAGWLRVLTDGAESARLDPRRAARASFVIAEPAEMIEVRTTDQQGDLLLATHLVRYDPSGEALIADHVRITLEGGQRLSFDIQPQGAGERATVEFQYAETAAWRAARLWLRQRLARGNADAPAARPWAKPALALALLAIAVAALFYLLPRQAKRQEVTQTTPTPLASPTAPTPDVAQQATPPPTPAASPQASPRVNVNEVMAMNVRAPRGSLEDSATRGEREEAVKQLQQGQKLHLVVEGRPDAARRALAESIKQRLIATGRFQISESDADAEIALKLTLKPSADPARVVVLARIVNAEGKVIWPLTPGYWLSCEGPVQAVAAKLSDELQRDLLKLQRDR